MKTPRFLLVAPLAIALSGCWPFSSKPAVVVDLGGNKPPATAPAGNPAAPAAPKTKVEQLEAEVAAAKVAEQKAHDDVKLKEKELESARLAALRAKLYWTVGIALLAALACLAGAIWLPLLKKQFIIGIAASVAVASLAVCLAAILPYLVWIGAGLLTIATIAAIYYWRNDSKSLRQVVGAVEAFKDQMPGYKEHFAKFIDTDADAWLNSVRTKLGLLKK
jgi:hypothetical protein